MKKLSTKHVSLSILFLTATFFIQAAEKITLKLPDGKSAPCDVVKVNKDTVVVRVDGKEQSIPTDKMDPKQVAQCYKQITPEKSAQARFDMGSFFFKKQLFNEAEEELNAAVAVDSGYKTKAEPFLVAIKAMQEVASAGDKAGDKSKKDDSRKAVRIKVGEDGTISADNTDPDGKGEDFAAKFKKKEVPARSPAEMKAFLDKRLEDLKPIGGNWHMVETKHFYCFYNGNEAKLQILKEWNEFLYARLCEVLKHKEGDKLWNNKMPIYYFEKYGQFQRFAGEIDESPGAAYSGGYFFANGRDVHICIPFMSERFNNNEKQADRVARNTLHHEATHAFLQLSGEDVPLSRWLHEGLAQFVEFWYDRENNQEGRENNPEKRDRAAFLQQQVSRGNIPSWSKMKMRPMSGMDLEGYAFAWSKLEFLYRNFDNQKLPQMVKLIKAGKPEEEAIATAFGFSADKLEEGYKIWLKEKAKTGFKF